MSLAYLDSVRDLGFHSFLILGDSNKSREEREFLETRQALAHLGHGQDDWCQTRESEYEEPHVVQAYVMLADDKRDTDLIRYKS